MSAMITFNFTITNVFNNKILWFITAFDSYIKLSTFSSLFISIFFISFLSLSWISRHITFIESFNIESNLFAFDCGSRGNFYSQLYTESILFLIDFLVSNKLLCLFFIVIWFFLIDFLVSLISHSMSFSVSGSVVFLESFFLVLF